jgi:hypothetical protein
MTQVVWFHGDNSTASRVVENELRRRGIEYQKIWDDGSERLVPAIEVGETFHEGLSNIQVYFFGGLEFSPRNGKRTYAPEVHGLAE